MKCSYSGIEVAKITLFVNNTIETDSFWVDKYIGQVFRPEDDDGTIYNSYSKSCDKVEQDLSKKFSNLAETFEFNYSNEQNTNKPHQFTWLEAHILIFLLLYPSGNQTLISRIKTNKRYFFSEIISFYNQLLNFLEDDRFKENGEWYEFEKRIIGISPVLASRDEINLKIKKMQNVSILKFLKNEIREKAIQAIDESLEKLIPSEVISKIPLISELELCEWEEKTVDGTLAIDDAEKIYSKEELEKLNPEDLESKNLKVDSFIHSGQFKGNTFDFAISSLNEFYYGIYGDKNKSIYKKICTIFEYLDIDIVTYDLAAVDEIDYDSLIKEMLIKSEQEEETLRKKKEIAEKKKLERAEKKKQEEQKNK